MNTFLASLPPWGVLLLKVGLSIGLFLVFLGLAIIGMLIINKSLRIIHSKEHHLTIQNRSNLPNQYSFEISSDLETLLCDYRANGKTLPALTITQVEETTEGTAQIGHPAGGGKDDNAAKKNLKGGVAKVGAFATILSTLGGLLPGSAGKALKAQGDQARAAQANARQAIDAPEEMKNRVSSLSEQSGRLTGQASPAIPAKAGSTAKLNSGAAFTTAAAEAVTTIEVKNSALTEVLMPGQELDLTLLLSATHKQAIPQDLAYIVCINAIPQVPITEPPLQRELVGMLRFPSVSFLRVALAPAANLLLGLFCLICFSYLVLRIW